MLKKLVKENKDRAVEKNGACRFCGQIKLVEALEEFNEDELNELATEQCNCYEAQDYFGISCPDAWAEDEAKKKLKSMTKDELIAAARQCFKIYQAYIGLMNRYDSLKAAIDIMRDQNTGILQTVKEIERLYEAASKEQGRYAEYSKGWRDFERYTDTLPKEAWIQ